MFLRSSSDGGPSRSMSREEATASIDAAKISSSNDYVEYVRRLAGGGSYWTADFQWRGAWSPRDQHRGGGAPPAEECSSASTASATSGAVHLGPNARSSSPTTTYFFPWSPWSPREASAVLPGTDTGSFLARHHSDYGRSLPLTEENLERHDVDQDPHFRRLHSCPPKSTEMLFPSSSAPSWGKAVPPLGPLPSAPPTLTPPSSHSATPSNNSPRDGLASGAHVRFGPAAPVSQALAQRPLDNFSFATSGNNKFDHLLTWLLDAMDENGNIVVPSGNESTPLSRVTTIQSQELLNSGSDADIGSPTNDGRTEEEKNAGGEAQDRREPGLHTLPGTDAARNLGDSWHVVAAGNDGNPEEEESGLS